MDIAFRPEIDRKELRLFEPCHYGFILELLQRVSEVSESRQALRRGLLFFSECCVQIFT